MADDTLQVSAQEAAGWTKRGAEPEVFEAAPGLQDKVHETLKKALQAQLAKEIETIGGRPGDRMTIHGKSGVSNSPAVRELVSKG